jgi:glucokinase
VSRILAGDVGGTKSVLALGQVRGDRVELGEARRYRSGEHSGLGEIVRRFLAASGGSADLACFGIAGPVEGEVVHTTNLPWRVDAAEIGQLLGSRRTWLINDLEATAWGLETLAGDDLVTLQAGRPEAKGNAVVVAAGTGLGVAGLYFDGRRHRPFPTEGGHADFAPRDEVEDRLLAWLRREQHGRVSCERLLSGPGLHSIYRFLRDSGRGDEPPWLAAELGADDPPAVISRAALDGRSPLCAEALDRFVSIYGAEAGNWGLRLMARGGIYLGGGIAPKIAPWLERPGFLAALADKGRMRPLVESMPVRLVLRQDTALRGAAQCALVRSRD